MDKKALTQALEGWLEGTPLFLVDVTVTADNDVTVLVDSAAGIDIEQCQQLSDKIHQAFPTDADDYGLEVGSAGLTAPFTVMGQYVKNIGEPVEVLTDDGRLVRGRLTEVDTQARAFTVTTEQKVKLPDKKKPVIEQVPLTFDIDHCRRVVYDIDNA